MVPTGNTDSKELWTYSDVADFLRLSEETIRKRVAAGTIPVVRIGRAVRFDPVDIRAWVEDRKEVA